MSNPMERAIARSAHAINEADRLAGLPPRYQEDVAEGQMLTVISVVRDEGSVVLFGTDDGRTIAVDHLVAQGLVERLHEEGEVSVLAADWQVL